jgi:hypothetical protein
MINWPMTTTKYHLATPFTMNDKEMNRRQRRRRNQNCVAEKGLTKEARNPT